jgi:hypothetical protein
MIEWRARRRIEGAAADFEKISGSLQCAKQKFLLGTAERRRRAGGNHRIADFFNRVQGLPVMKKA